MNSVGGRASDERPPVKTQPLMHARPLVIRTGRAGDASGSGGSGSGRAPSADSATSRDATLRLADAIRSSLDDRERGAVPTPVFVVGPTVDAEEAADEVATLGYPAGTALLMRTSGSTTGTGKIVAHAWDSLLASVNATHAALHGPGAWTGNLPLEHIAGFQTILRSIISGAPVGTIDMSAESLERWLADTAAANHRYVSVVPVQIQRLLARPDLLALLERTTLLVGGQAITDATLRAAREAGLDIFTSYGATETAGGCVYNGLPIGDTAIELSASGQISLRGSVVALGYLGGADPGAFLDTAPRTHVTRDVGRIVDGRLAVLGRTDSAITTRGLTVMPALIEDALAELGVDAVVVGVPDRESGEAVLAITAGPAPHDELHAAVKRRLGAGWAPALFAERAEIDPAWADGWPLTASGKVNRREIATRAAEKYRANGDE